MVKDGEDYGVQLTNLKNSSLTFQDEQTVT